MDSQSGKSTIPVCWLNLGVFNMTFLAPIHGVMGTRVPSEAFLELPQHDEFLECFDS